MGGTLYQDLPSERPGPVDHNRAGTRTDRSHAIRLAPESLAAEALGVTSMRVNSFHHQGIRELAPGLVATGWSEDDLIEAVEGPEGQPWMLAVQWHPEEMHAEAAAPERGLFKALVERAGDRGRVSGFLDRGARARWSSRPGRRPGRSPR